MEHTFSNSKFIPGIIPSPFNRHKVIQSSFARSESQRPASLGHLLGICKVPRSFPRKASHHKDIEQASFHLLGEGEVPEKVREFASRFLIMVLISSLWRLCCARHRDLVDFNAVINDSISYLPLKCGNLSILVVTSNFFF